MGLKLFLEGLLSRPADLVTPRVLKPRAPETHTRVLREQAHLLDLAHDAIIMRDIQSTILFWNHGAEELYGWTRDEALGQCSHTLLHTSPSLKKERIWKTRSHALTVEERYRMIR